MNNRYNRLDLAFAGRTSELATVRAGIASAFDNASLHVVVVIGERGIGKTVFLDQLVANDEVVVRARLFAGASTALGPLIASALDTAVAARADIARLIASEALTGELAAAIDGLARLARLRRVVIVIDDLHHLTASGAVELATLLDSLEDSSVAFVAATLPQPREPQLVLERFDTTTVTLQELSIEEVSASMSATTGAAIGNDIARLFHASTFGSPLALRNAVRHALGNGLMDVSGGTLKPLATTDMLRAALDSVVVDLAGGLLIALDDSQRDNASRLAMLGEVFDVEAARTLGVDASVIPIVTTLRSRPSPICGSASSLAMAFTDTLAHRALLQRAPHTTDVIALLVDVLRGDGALYDIVPFLILADAIDIAGADSDGLREACTDENLEAIVARGLQALYAMDNSPDWQRALTLSGALERIAAAGRWPAQKSTELVVRIVQRRISLLRRDAASASYHEALDKLLQLTADPTTVQLAEMRLTALSTIHRTFDRSSYERWRTLHDDATTLVTAWPELALSRGYIVYMQTLSRLAVIASDADAIAVVDEWVDDTASTGDDDTQRLALEYVAVNLLPAFANSAQQRKREESFRAIASRRSSENTTFVSQKFEWWFANGDATSIEAEGDSAVAAMHRKGLHVTAATLELIALAAKRLRGEDTSRIAEGARRIHRNARDDVKAGVASAAAGPLALALAVSGASDELTLLIDEGVIDRAGLRPSVASRCSNVERVGSAHVGTPVRIEQVADVVAMLDSVHVGTPVRIEQVADLVAVLDDDNANVDRMTLAATLEWLCARGLVAAAAHLLERCAPLLQKRDATAWRARFDEICRDASPHNDRPASLSVFLFGTIRAVSATGEELRVQGGRSKTLLGLMAANATLNESLDAQEFASLAVGEEDPQKARRALPVAVFRLREIVGQSAIRTDGPVPKLDERVVDVDYIGATRAFDEAESAYASRSLVAASAGLRRALSIVDGNVPFPGLFDEFFESAREDFENRLRRITISLCRALIREGDAATGAELLRMALRSIEGDEEVAEMLESALNAEGRAVDALRLRRALASDE